MTAIERAEALLEAADLPEPECGCLPRYHRHRGLHESDCPWLAWRENRLAAGKRIEADKVDTLRGYIGAVKALVALMDDMDPYWRDGWSDEQIKLFAGLPCSRGRDAIADFERLFPETPASAD